LKGGDSHANLLLSRDKKCEIAVLNLERLRESFSSRLAEMRNYRKRHCEKAGFLMWLKNYLCGHEGNRERTVRSFIGE
jgi:hypothetical protein